MPIKLQTDLSSVSVQGPSGCTVTELAEEAGLILNTRCAGHGVCGGCAIKLGPGKYEIDGEPCEIFQHGYRTALACQTVVLGHEAEITVPATSILEQEAQIEGDFQPKKMDPDQTGCIQIIELSTGAFPEGERDAWTWVSQRLQASHNICVQPPPTSLLNAASPWIASPPDTFRIALTQHLDDWHLLSIEPADETAPLIGIAVDIGTTTVAAWGINLLTGEPLARASMYNQQIRKADDVGSRISYGSQPDRLQDLQRLVIRETLLPLIEELRRDLNIEPTRIVQIAVSGNTVMTHLFAGISPASIGQLPFLPVFLNMPPVRAEALQLPEYAGALITAAPGISGYVGGDLTSGLIESDIGADHRTEMLIDIGTNGEIILNVQGQLTACATAAGPAFEGYGLAHGCRAATGAVETVTIDEHDQFTLGVIGKARPTGICGSGIIDFIAQGFLTGLINTMGRFDRDRLKAVGRLETNSTICGDSIGCILAHPDETGRRTPLFVTEADVAQVLKAKAAIFAGILTLLESQGICAEELERICLAGGFARHINIRHAVILGLLPDVCEDRIELVGNTSLSGAAGLLTRAGTSTRMQEIARRPNVVELNREPQFEGHFIDALAVPNMDTDLFPSVPESP